jgi:hypothetical protein
VADVGPEDSAGVADIRGEGFQPPPGVSALYAGAGTVMLGRPDDAVDDGTTALELLRAQRRRRTEELLLISPTKAPPPCPTAVVRASAPSPEDKQSRRPAGALQVNDPRDHSDVPNTLNTDPP